MDVRSGKGRGQPLQCLTREPSPVRVRAPYGTEGRTFIRTYLIGVARATGVRRTDVSRSLEGAKKKGVSYAVMKRVFVSFAIAIFGGSLQAMPASANSNPVLPGGPYQSPFAIAKSLGSPAFKFEKANYLPVLRWQQVQAAKAADASWIWDDALLEWEIDDREQTPDEVAAQKLCRLTFAADSWDIDFVDEDSYDYCFDSRRSQNYVIASPKSAGAGKGFIVLDRNYCWKYTDITGDDCYLSYGGKAVNLGKKLPEQLKCRSKLLPPPEFRGPLVWGDDRDYPDRTSLTEPACLPVPKSGGSYTFNFIATRDARGFWVQCRPSGNTTYCNSGYDSGAVVTMSMKVDVKSESVSIRCYTSRGKKKGC